jgi:NTP pyrophosphatase (non-canonical NTP hydrolase)
VSTVHTEIRSPDIRVGEVDPRIERYVRVLAFPGPLASASSDALAGKEYPHRALRAVERRSARMSTPNEDETMDNVTRQEIGASQYEKQNAAEKIDGYQHPLKAGAPDLTAAEYEALALLCEECCEVGQAVAKAQRHGFDSIDTDEPEGPTNLERVADELGDVLAAMDILCANVDGDGMEWWRRRVQSARRDKLKSIQEHLHYAKVPT